MTHPVSTLAVIALAGAVVFSAGAAGAAASEDPDWPCVQRLMPEISPATVWDGPPVDDAARAWREAHPVRDLVVRIADRRMTPEEAERDIAKRARRRPKALVSRRSGRVCGPSGASKSFDDAPHRHSARSWPKTLVSRLYGS